MANARPVGIDLGTTNSAVAWVDESGRSAMVNSAEGDLLTPSVVLFDDAEIVVGKEARSATTVHPDQVAEWVKRDMGAPVYSRPIRGEYLPPEVIQACILRKLKGDIVRALGPGAKTVITVPAFFDEPRRKATADAGEMAGLTVLDIVNEPTAAALAFGETLGYLTPTGVMGEEMTVLVYDLGGGTFDVTLLRLAPGDIRTLATDGDVQLGGHDWDLRLVDLAAESFQQAYGVDPRQDPAGLSRLYNGVIEAKHALSARNRTTIRVDHAGHSHEIQVTREEFEQLTADLLERTAYTAQEVLRAAGIDCSQVARVLLVGGSTRMPMVGRKLRETTGIVPDRTVNPDEAVARGAALYANYLLAKQAEEGPGPDFQVTNVNAHGLGVEGIDPGTLRKTNVVLIPRNTPLPATFAEKFVTKSENQRSIVVQVLEGESSLPGECTAIGRTVIRDLPPGLPKGWPVEVTFQYGSNGRLTVKAVVPGTHREVGLEIERQVGLSNEGIAQWKQAVAASSGFDAFEAMLEEVLDLGGARGQAPPPSGQPNPGQGTSDRWDAGPRPPAAPAGNPPPPGSSPPQPGNPGPPQASVVPEHASGWGESGHPMPPAKAVFPSQPVPSPSQPAVGPKKPVPRWLIQVIGFVASAIIGIAIGYLIVSWLFPNSKLLQIW